MRSGDKQAVSPVLATLLLIMIAVVAGGLTYAWAMSFASNQLATAGVFLVLDRVHSWSGSDVYVTIKNSGSATATIDAAYIGTKPGLYDSSNSGLSTDIPPGTATDLQLTDSFAPGTVYYFRIVYTNGYAIEFSARYPTS